MEFIHLTNNNEHVDIQLSHIQLNSTINSDLLGNFILGLTDGAILMGFLNYLMFALSKV